MKFKKDRIEAFLNILPQDRRFALEYRNETWLTQEVHDILTHYNVAAVTVDEPLLPPEIRLTSDIAYVRWHGRGKKMWYNYRYSKDELGDAKIKDQLLFSYIIQTIKFNIQSPMYGFIPDFFF